MEDSPSPFEQTEELMQHKVEPNLKQEMVTKMLSPDLTKEDTGEYMQMLSKFPDMFFTSYEEIRGFKGEDLHIDIKEGALLVKQKLRRMGQEQTSS